MANSKTEEIEVISNIIEYKRSGKKVVLITGVSSGIGRSCAEELAFKGYKVYGTLRRKIEDHLPYETLLMDVTDKQSIYEAIQSIITIEGRIDILINNAGIGIAGPIEETSMEEARLQFDTNFFGVVEVCKTVIPYMRNDGGRILNISSIGGLIGLPFQGFYSASKFALEGFSEALRIELKKYKIEVALIEPGDVKTKFTENRKISKKSLSPGFYFDQLQKSLKTIEEDESKGIDPKIVAQKISKILLAKSLNTRYLIGAPMQTLSAKLKAVLPDSMFESIISSHYKCG